MTAEKDLRLAIARFKVCDEGKACQYCRSAIAEAAMEALPALLAELDQLREKTRKLGIGRDLVPFTKACIAVHSGPTEINTAEALEELPEFYQEIAEKLAEWL